MKTARLFLFIALAMFATSTVHASTGKPKSHHKTATWKKKSKNLHKAAKRNGKRSGGDLVKFNCHGKRR